MEPTNSIIAQTSVPPPAFRPENSMELVRKIEVGPPSFWWRFSRNRLGVAGLATACFLVLIALAAMLTPTAWGEDKSPNVLESPSGEHWLGTDDIGRDLFWRVLQGAHRTLGCGLGAVALAMSLGVPLGLIAGFNRGWIGGGIMRVMDVLLAMPSLLLALALMTVLEANLQNAVVAIGLVYAPRFARISRASTLQQRNMDYVSAAEVTGNSGRRILLRHIFPNTLSPLIVMGTLSLSGAILEIAALNFLGLGATDKPEWGNMLTDARNYLMLQPWMMTVPGIALLTTVFCVNLVGDGLRDALDVRLSA